MNGVKDESARAGEFEQPIGVNRDIGPRAKREGVAEGPGYRIEQPAFSSGTGGVFFDGGESITRPLTADDR